MQAAVGVSQLNHLDGFIDARRRNFAFLKDALGKVEDTLVLPEATPGTEPSWFGFPITVREAAPFGRAALLRFLNASRIETRLLFGGNLVHQPYMAGRNFRVHGDLSNSDCVMHRTFWIGVYPALGEGQLAYVAERIIEFCKDSVYWA